MSTVRDHNRRFGLVSFAATLREVMAWSGFTHAARRVLGAGLVSLGLAALGCSGDIDARDRDRDDGGSAGSFAGGGAAGTAGKGAGGASGLSGGGASGSAGTGGSAGGVTCTGGKISCAGSCVDASIDALNCGGCGRPCATGQACEAGVCRQGCSVGLLQCGASCVDTNTSTAHCGMCNRACTGTQTCSAGACACPNAGTLCGTECFATQTDALHCGNCTTACGAGQTCVAGQCTCPQGQTRCGTACVDINTSNEHCGGCNEPCGTGSTCMAGECKCPTGQALCGTGCVDTQSNAMNCGECNHACAMGQTCATGMCSGAGGVGADGCMGGLARNVTISRIDAFQTVEVNIMEGGEELTGNARNTDLAEARPTVFRIFVTPGSGWTARELSARVTLVNGATSQELFAKKSISRASDVDDPATTFQVSVPADQIKVDTHYYVELVECGTPPSGDATAPRFPAAQDVSLGVLKTGPLKVNIVPITSNSRAPDTTEESLQPYLELLEAIYPVDHVEITVGGGITAGYPVDWNGTLDAVRSKRASDRPEADVYYYGLIRPTESFREFCGNGCTAGIGYVPDRAQDANLRVAMGIGFPGDASPGAMAHEIGHNHGRNHAPCVPPGSSISGVDENYPKTGGYAGGGIGVWGYDQRSEQLINPDGITDMMGYCNETWISDYTYDGIFNRVIQVNSAKIRVNPDLLGRFRVLLVDAAGPRWGRPITELTVPDGIPEVAEVRDADGTVIENVVVYRTLVSEIDAASILVPEPRPDWYSVKVDGYAAHPFGAPSLPPAH